MTAGSEPASPRRTTLLIKEIKSGYCRKGHFKSNESLSCHCPLPTGRSFTDGDKDAGYPGSAVRADQIRPLHVHAKPEGSTMAEK